MDNAIPRAPCPGSASPPGSARAPRANLAARLAAALGAAFEALLLWQERSRERRQLREMSDHLLKDLGLSRADIEKESSKPFWRD